MAEKFDPYHLWLGIAKAEQPAHHYRLLGIAPFESDPEIIEIAADQRMAFVRTFQSGKHTQECQRVLNELAAARVCLLNKETREAYDKQLRDQLEKQKKKTASAAKNSASKQLKTRKRPKTQKAAPVIETKKKVTPARSTASPSADRTIQRGRKKRSAFPVSWAIGIAAVLLLGLGAAFLSRGRSSNEEVAQDRDAKPAVEKNSLKELATGQESKGKTKSTSKQPPEGNQNQPPSKRPEGGKPIVASLPRIPTKPPEEENPPQEEPTSHPPAEKPEAEPAGEISEVPVESPSESEPPAALEPIPEATLIEAKLKQVRRFFPFAEARTAEEKAKLAGELFKASDGSEDSVECYVLIDQAWKIAQEANDFRLALDAIAVLGESYEVDALALAESVVSQMRIPTKLRDENRALAQACGDLMWQAVEEQEYELAIKLASTTTSVARRIGDIEMAKQMAEHLKQIRRQQSAYQVLTKALAQLEAAPDDPAANFQAGQYYCLIREDWETGLPYLSRSQEDPWSSLAKEELKGTEDSSAQLALGNHWWEEAQKHRDSQKAALLRHAATWYEDVLASLDQLERIRIEKRLATIDELEASGTRKPRLPTSGLVAHYRFDERSGEVVKDLVGKRDGKIFGAERVRGHLGGAIRFDGVDDAVVIPNLETLLGGTASLAVWIKTQQRGVPEMWKRPGLAGFEAPGGSGDIFWGVLDRQGRIAVTSGDRGAAVSRDSVSDDLWHHVVLMRDASSGQVAVALDGELQHQSIAGSGIISRGFRTLGYISQSQGKKNPTGFYSGLLDDVRIYDRVLTVEEIANFVGKGSRGSRNSKHPTPVRTLSRKGPMPVVHWPLDEGKGAEVRDAMGKIHLRVFGAQWTEGVSGSALHFDGQDDYIDVPKVGTNTAFTLAMWIQPESLRPKFSSLFHNHGWRDHGLHVHVQSSGRFTFEVKGIKAPGQGAESLSSRSPIGVGTWQHVAIAYDKNAAKAVHYIDGELNATHPISRPIACQFGPGRIGGWDKRQEPRFFHGKIDDIRLYDYALSIEEVAAVTAEARKKRRGR